MSEFCPECGKQLVEVWVVIRHRARFLKCPRPSCESYLEVVDDRNGEYPLQRLQPGVAHKLDAASEEQIELALSRIKTIDYRTISIVGFEHTLLGCYDPKRDYKVVYPE